MLSGTTASTVARPLASRVRPSANFAALPSSIPSLIHTTRKALASLNAASSRERSSGRAESRAAGCRAAARAATEAASTASRLAGRSSGADVAKLTTAFVLRAPSSISFIMDCRLSQPEAAAQVLSTMSNSGSPRAIATWPGDQNGCDTPRMTRVAMARRKSISHQGVRSGCSSRLISSSNRRSGGKRTDWGRGGVKRSNHQMTGRRANAPSAKGVPKASD